MDNEETSPFLPELQYASKSRRDQTKIVLACCLLVSLVINGITVFAWKSQNLDEVCSRYTQQYNSPLMESIAVRYDTVTYNGTFSHDGLYRQEAGPEVDQAWRELGTENQHYIIPEGQAEKYGLDPGHTKIVPEQGGGYPVLFEFEHHLHCLDLVRKSTWFNAPYYFSHADNSSFSAGEATMKKHANHCIDMIRQVIMCQPDVGVFGQYWVNEIDGPFVNFDTKHKCKNFWEIKKWVTGHQPIDEAEMRVRYREGDILLDTIP